MAFRTLKLAGTALIAAALLAPAAVSAQNAFTTPQVYSSQGYGQGADRARDRYGYPRAGSRRDGYARNAYYEDQPPPRRAVDRERRERCDRDSAGSLLGAIAGGLLGDSGAGNRGSHGGGALRGRDADRDCD